MKTSLPPQPLPEHLWGEQWRFATFSADELIAIFAQRPIPIRSMPDALLPLNMGLASTVSIPGVIIYGGRKSLLLARWLEGAQPSYLEYIPTQVEQSGGLILHTGENERWIVATFEDNVVAQAAQNYEQKKQASQGLHFLLVEPDDSGITSTGFWLLIN